MTTADVASLLGDVTSTLGGLFQQIDWAEAAIGRAMDRYPAERDTLYHSFQLLTPTHARMGVEFVYRSHCRELLSRVANGADTRPGTAAELCCMLSDVSQVAPLRSPAAGLYFRMWTVAFPDKPGFSDSAQHHEALEGSTIDDLEAEARRKLTVKTRVLGEITCPGSHHGEPAQCKYAGVTS